MKEIVSMQISSVVSRTKLFSHLYIEERVMDHPLTQKIIKKFDSANIVTINHYKDVFNRTSQNFSMQSISKKLILAHKDGKFLHDGSPYSDSFDFKQFFVI